MYTKEQKILRFSMMLLFLALMIIYVIRYQIQGNKTKNIQATTNSGSIQIISKTGTSIRTTETTQIDQNTGFITTSTGTIFEPSVVANKTGNILSSQISMTGDSTNKNIKVLSGTSIYYGKIAIIDQLGIKYQYALTDTKGIWYIYLGTPSYDFSSIARALKGNIYTIATEQELLQNKLFGNKVVYINLPEYKDKQVFMLVYLNEGIRLIQVEHSLYYKSKSYIKSLFTDI